MSAQSGAAAKLREARIVSPLLESLFNDPSPQLRRALIQCIARVAADAQAAEEMSQAGAVLALTAKFDPRGPDSDVALTAVEALLRYPHARSTVISDAAFAGIVGMPSPLALPLRAATLY